MNLLPTDYTPQSTVIADSTHNELKPFFSYFSNAVITPVIYANTIAFVIAAVADAIRTSLGPRGMDKMVCLHL